MMHPHPAPPPPYGAPAPSYCPFCKSAAAPPRCQRCGRDPTASRRQCQRCLQMTPVQEPPCMHCGAQHVNDVAWKLPLLLLVALILCVVMAVIGALAS